MVLDFAGDGDDDGKPPVPRYRDALARIACEPGPSQTWSLQLPAADDDLIFDEEDFDELAIVTTGCGRSSLWLPHLGVDGGSSFVNTTLYASRVTTDRDLNAIDYDDDEVIRSRDLRELDLPGVRTIPDSVGDDELTYAIGPYNQERLYHYHRLDIRASRTTRVGRRGRLTFFIDIQNLDNRDNLRGYAVADPECRYDTNSGTRVTFPEEYWLSIIPSFGVSWEF
jgi:hypothetical protein